MTQRIDTLPVGTAFRLACNGRAGVLLSLTPGAASVRYTGETRHVTLPDGREFDAAVSTRPVTIARTTQVRT